MPPAPGAPWRARVTASGPVSGCAVTTCAGPTTEQALGRAAALGPCSLPLGSPLLLAATAASRMKG